MTLSATVLWFVLALIVAGAEMMTGTVYLLAVAAACVGGGAASFFGLPVSGQFAVCGAVILAGIFLLHRVRAKKAEAHDEMQMMDSGRTVRVDAVGSDGLAVVQYRGAPWIARAQEGDLTIGVWLIDRVDGTQLVLKPVRRSA